MTLDTILNALPQYDPRRVLDFAKSEMFERTFKEGMALVEETASYLDGPGRAASKRLARIQALAYASESMKLTTRLMQVASWLLVQRAVRDGEMSLTEASSDKYRLAARAGAEEVGFADGLPEALKSLAARGMALHERVRRLDMDMYAAGSSQVNEVGAALAQLEAAFAGA